MTKFTSLFNGLLSIIDANRDSVDEALVNELTYYYSALQAFDNVRQNPEEVYFRELSDLQAITKRILSKFKLTQPQEPQAVKQQRETIRGRVFQHLANLIDPLRGK